MLDLEFSEIPSQIAAALSLRGSDLPPLQWQSARNKAGRTVLDGSDDTSLFGRCPIVDAPMAAAVRALLYLWNGWLDECQEAAQLAPSNEQAYIKAMCRRHAGHSAEAKALLRDLLGHPIVASLSKDVLAIPILSPDPAQTRFRGIIEMGGEWEPFAFEDLYAQAIGGQLKVGGTEYVRLVLCREFQLMFRHCYELATGRKIPSKSAAPRPKPAPQRKPPKPKQAAEASKAAEKSNEAKPQKKQAAPTPAFGGSVRFACPKCGNTNVAPANLCGKAVRCSSCGTPLMVPHPKPAHA